MKKTLSNVNWKRFMVSVLTAVLVAGSTLSYYQVVKAENNVSVKSVLGDAYGYGIFVGGRTVLSGDSESNMCTTDLVYSANIGYSGVGTIYVGGQYQGSGNNIRCANLILNQATFAERGGQWFVNVDANGQGGTYVGTTGQVGAIEKGYYDIATAISGISTSAVNLLGRGEELKPNNEGKYNLSLVDGQTIYKVDNVSYFEPQVSVSNSKTVIFNITPSAESISIVGQSVNGVVNYPNQDEASIVVWNFGDYSGTINMSTMRGTIIAPNANVVLSGGNLSGRVVAASFTASSESHFKGSEWHPETTTEPPVTTTEPPVTTTEPPVTTTEPPVTTTEPPVTTTEPPVTTTEPPVTTTEPPVTTTEPPVTTTEPPVTTTEPPVTTTEPPVTTTEPPVTTTEPPVTTTEPPVTTTEPPVTTTEPPVTTTEPPVTTTEPPVTTTEPPVTTTEPPVTTTEPPVTTTEPPVTTTEPPVTTTEPPVTTTEPPVTTTEPPVTTTEPPVTTTEPPVTTTEPPVTTTEPPVTTTEPPVTTTEPPVTTTEPPVTTTEPPVTTTEPPVTTTNPPSVPTETPEVLGSSRRLTTIEDEETPLADAAVLGSNRRPQTGDGSETWVVIFLASLSGLAAWLLQGRKK